MARWSVALVALAAVACLAPAVDARRLMATIQVRLRGYSGNGRITNGDKCDWWPYEKCDPLFIVCLGSSYSQIAPSSWKDSSKNNCLKRQETGSWDQTNSFTDTYAFTAWDVYDDEMSNLQSFGIGWQIWDHDGGTAVNDHDFMFADGFDMGTISPTFRAGQDYQYYSRYRSDKGDIKIHWDIRAVCGTGYGGDRCEKYCEQEPNQQRYTCLSGNHICKTGWTGSTCQTDINACDTNPCGANAFCTDLKCDASKPCSYSGNAAGRTCTCNIGYQGDGQTCVNANACTNFPCSPDAICNDLPPPFPDSAAGRTCTCKDGFYGTGEVCTDENECKMDTHDCHENAECLNAEGGFDCKCKTGFSGDGKTCTPKCGDGLLVAGEGCDDGNKNNGDGCNELCKVEQGWTCLGEGAGSCKPTCGDGELKGGESCDDRNKVSGDGCSELCIVETGFTCDGTGPGSCKGKCGDGLKVLGEECDVGNPAAPASSGCVNCEIEPGFFCEGEGPGSCSGICGDSLKVAGEQCDDGNVRDDDGCSSDCKQEEGWICTGQGENSCKAICGDELIRGPEGCDDGGIAPGDGCGPTCQPEQGYTCFGAGKNQCTDVDECKSSPCHADAICTNHLGGYSCACKTGFEGDGFDCLANCGEFKAELVAAHTERLIVTCSGTDTHFGGDRTCTLDCQPEYEKVGEPVPFTCNQRSFWDGAAPLCVYTSNLPSFVTWTQNSDSILPVPKIAGGTGSTQVLYDNIPPGMNIDPEVGMIGKPDVAGTFNIARRVVVLDDANESQQPNRRRRGVVTSFDLPEVTVSISDEIASSGQRYLAVIERPFVLPPREVTGGLAPLRFEILSGILPPGVTLNSSTGGLGGTPSVAQLFPSIVLAVYDANNATVRFEPFNLHVGDPLNISWVRNGSLDFTVPVNKPYLLPAPANVNIINSNGLVRYFVSSGLPPGLDVSITSGTVSGIPTQLGVFVFTIIANDEAGDSVALETITMNVVQINDCDEPANGPNGRGCGKGFCVDTVKFDGAFTCDCTSVDLTGDNCDDFQAVKSKASKTSLAIGLPSVIIVIILVIVLIVWRRKALAAQKLIIPFVFPAPDEWEYDRRKLRFRRELGSGEFGVVHAGTAVDIRNIKGVTEVAIKQCKGENLETKTKREFVEEAQLMKRLHHPNLVRLLGVCLQEEPLLIITELMVNGDLKSFLRSRLGLTMSQLLGFCLDVASGVQYIASQNVVHRDLAARNCLVDKDLRVKLADFGLGRDTAYKDYYRLTGQALLPVRWMALESLSTGQFTKESDVWALGITCWEILSRGEVPYAAMGNMEVFRHVQNGNRLERPPNCPPALYQLLHRCWVDRPALRCTAAEVAEGIRKIIPTIADVSTAAPDGAFRGRVESAYFRSNEVFSGDNKAGMEYNNPLYNPAADAQGFDDDNLPDSGYLTVGNRVYDVPMENGSQSYTTLAMGDNPAYELGQAGPDGLSNPSYLYTAPSAAGHSEEAKVYSIPTSSPDRAATYDEEALMSHRLLDNQCYDDVDVPVAPANGF